MQFLTRPQKSKINPSAKNFSSPAHSVLNLGNLNPAVKAADYAVRGLLYLKSTECQQILKQQKATGKRVLPFDEIIACNIGNPQALGQKPLTYHRQVCALLEWPELINKAETAKLFAPDAIELATQIMTSHPIGVGAYSDSRGIDIVREWVAKFIQERDSFPSSPSNIFLTDGASPGITNALRCIIRGSQDAILVPRPQYPLYSATITLLGGSRLSYDLAEDSGWRLEVSDLHKAVSEAMKKGQQVRALVIINPGNPTGQLMDKENIQEVIEFCAKKGLVLLADEVYQENNYTDHKKFVSFKKVLMESKFSSSVPLFSFHSVSKGYLGECGKRGGYVEMTNIDPEVMNEYYKLTSISLCSNLMGQIMTGVMVNPPKKGSPSFPLFEQEKNEICDSLKRRAKKLEAALKPLQNISLSPIEGALYAFPKIELPPKAVAEAKKQGYTPDTHYCLALLENTGLVVVPGSGFGQKEGTFHFRTTILPPENKFETMVASFVKFHTNYIQKFS